MEYAVCTDYGKANIQALKISNELAHLDCADESMLVDFRQFRENTPFANLVIINALRRFVEEYPANIKDIIRKEAGGYLEHIGFYRAIGVKIGKNPGEAHANDNYVPITEIPLRDHNFYRTIDEKANQLAATLQFNKGLQKMLGYMFVEMIRNAFEHAETESVLIAAQKWPARGMVEIAIADSGCGVQETLGKFFSTGSDNLLRLACKPGVSARSNYRYLEKDDPWRNSGYGLYIMKELALAYGGSFLICSGGYALRYTADEFATEKEETIETDYKGTAVGIRFSTETDNDFETVRNRVTLIGQLRAEQIKGAIRTASRSSGGRYRM